MSPRTQTCLNVVDAMPNSFDAAVSVQYLLAFFTCSNPAFHDSKMDGVHKIVTSRSVGSGGRPLSWSNISAIQEKSVREILLASFSLRRSMRPPRAAVSKAHSHLSTRMGGSEGVQRCVKYPHLPITFEVRTKSVKFRREHQQTNVAVNHVRPTGNMSVAAVTKASDVESPVIVIDRTASTN